MPRRSLTPFARGCCARPAFPSCPQSAQLQGDASTRWSATVLVLALATGLVPAETPAAECPTPKAVMTTAASMKYCADPIFDAAIACTSGGI